MPLYVQEVLLAPTTNGRNLLAPTGGATVGLDLGTSALQFTDLQLIRDSVDVLAQRRGTNPQMRRIYKTYTDASNYERLAAGYVSGDGVFALAVEQAGTGIARDFQLTTRGASNISLVSGQHITLYPQNILFLGSASGARWVVDNGAYAGLGFLLPFVHNTYDLGASGQAVRTGNFGTSVIAPLYQQNGANGQSLNIQSLSESTTIAAAATTDTVIQIPSGAIVVGVSVRVTTVIPTAVTFNYGVAGATARYGTGISTAATTTYAGTDDGLRFYGSAISIRFTPNATPAAATGVIRSTVHYLTLTPATS